MSDPRDSDSTGSGAGRETGPEPLRPGLERRRPRPPVAVPPPAAPPLEAVVERRTAPPPSLPPRPAPDAVSLQKVLHLLARRRWLILGVMAAVLAAAALQVFTTTPLFRSFATVQIDPEAPNVLGTEPADDSVYAPKSREEYLATQARKLQTRALARRVIERLELTEHPAFTRPLRHGFFVDRLQGVSAFFRRLAGGDEAGAAAAAGDERAGVDRFLDHLGVQVLRNTRLIEVSFTSPDPELAATVVNTVVEEFIEQSLESRYQATTKVTDFLSAQLQDLKETVEKSEAGLVDYARDNNIVNLNERQTIIVQKLADLTDELTRVESELIEERARYQAVADATPADFPQILANPTIARLEGELSEARRRLAGMSSHHGPAWPARQELEGEIAELAAQLVDEQRRAIELERSRYQLALDRHAQLQAAVEEQRRIVDRLNTDSIRYSTLQRDATTNKELYEGLLQRLKEAGVNAGLTWSNIHLADRAEVPRHPSFPSRALALAVALVIGLCLGVGAGVAAESLDDSFNGTEEVVETLRLPALGMIPILAGEETAAKLRALPGRRRGRQQTEALSPLVAFRQPQRWQEPAWEAYRSLRTSILLSHSGKPPQSILITSALPGEGKSTTVANTAVVLAQTGARTLILDLDMRKPSLADLFGVASHQGMSTFLSGNSDLSSLVQESGIPNLYVVPAGPPAPNPAELVGAQRMHAGIQLLQEYFDHILIDTPPCLEITDALVLSPHVDGVMLVVRAGKTPREVVRRASDRLLAVGGKILGVLVNAVDVRRAEYGYYRSYYRSYYGRPQEPRVRRSA